MQIQFVSALDEQAPRHLHDNPEAGGIPDLHGSDKTSRYMAGNNQHVQIGQVIADVESLGQLTQTLDTQGIYFDLQNPQAKSAEPAQNAVAAVNAGPAPAHNHPYAGHGQNKNHD